MKLTEYIIAAMPWAQSELTAEFFEWGTDEEDALKQFRNRYPSFRVKEIKEA